MKLLLLTEYFPRNENDITGGVEARAWYLCKYLAKDNEVMVISSRQKGMPKIEKKGRLTVLRQGPILPYSNSGDLLKRYKHMKNAIKLGKKQEFDQVHGMSFLHYESAWKIARAKNKPCSITYHECWIGEWHKIKPGLTGLFGEISERRALKHDYDKIISVSKTTKQQLKKKTGKDSTVIPNGIDLSEFKSYTGRKNGIIIANRLVKTKNVDQILKAAKGINQEIRIIGEGPEKQHLKQIAKKLDINAKFLGRVDRKTLIKELTKAKLYVNASTLEGFGIGVIEAAAAGTTYVVSDIPAFREVSNHGEGGYLFAPGNTEQLRNKLQEALNKNLDNTSLKKLVKKYDWKKIAKEFEKVIVE